MEEIMKDKLVRIHQETYDELVKLGDASQTPNDIIVSLIKKQKGENKK